MTDGFANGGFEDRYRVARVDGQPMREQARYVVLNYAEDRHAKVALTAYADSIEEENPHFAADLRAALESPEDWPAQHD